MWNQFHKRVAQGVTSFFNVHVPRAVEQTNRFFGTAINVAHHGHRLLGHVHGEVVKSPLFSAEQKRNVSKAHAFGSMGLERIGHLHKNVESFSTGLAKFRV